MNSLKPRDSLAETDTSGRFVRKDSAYREIISGEHPLYKPENGRYHLYISKACPWANRCYSVILMKGLQQCIGVSVVHPTEVLEDYDKENKKGSNGCHFK